MGYTIYRWLPRGNHGQPENPAEWSGTMRCLLATNYDLAILALDNGEYIVMGNRELRTQWEATVPTLEDAYDLIIARS